LCSDGPAADADDDDVLASVAAAGNYYEVVYPVQTRGSEHMHGLDTRDHRGGRHKVTIHFICQHEHKTDCNTTQYTKDTIRDAILTCARKPT